MKIVLIITTFILLLSSQLLSGVAGIGVCVEGNYNISNPYHFQSNNAKGFGFGAGIDVDFKLSEKLVFQVSILYKRFLYSSIEEGRDEMGDPADYKLKVDINSIISPFLLKYRLFRTEKNSVDLSLGPSIIFPFGGNIEVESSWSNASLSFGREGLETDFGINVGLFFNQKIFPSKTLSPYFIFQYNFTADFSFTEEVERGSNFSIGLSVKEVL